MSKRQRTALVPATCSRRSARTQQTKTATTSRRHGPIAIRAARATDGSIIARFNREMALETEGRRLGPQRVRRGVKALLADAAKGTYYVAESGGEVIGQLLITYEWSDWRNGNFWWIQSVFVAPDWRGRGVFKVLHAHVERLAQKRKDVCGVRLYVDAHNTKAKEVYARLGLRATHYELWETDFVLGR
ncbi:MAG: acetyltransferase [Limisphaerales bacterium]|nr:MAG: acetyltransferase [Limisphaerales bacterium]KAG0508430.1 MAG: acetyltransferase [Limisphaerales bacterium]TXT47922.1 MAG: acetyltransferase [Limisphaerales bacterium]